MKLQCPIHGQAAPCPKGFRFPRAAQGLIYCCPICGLQFHEEFTPPAASYYGDAGYAEVRAREDRRKAARLWRLIASQRPAPGRYLEIGPGLGFLAAQAAAANWQVEVVEPHPALLPQLGAHRVHPTTFETAPLAPGFRLIVMADVLEHFTDPIAMLAKAATLADADGLLALETPNRGSFYAHLAREYWVGYSPHHAFFFTRSALAELLRLTGWEIVRCATSPLDLFSLDGFWRLGLQERLRRRAQRAGNPPPGRGLRDRLLRSPWYWAAVGILNWLPNALTAPLGWGDQLLVIARRKPRQ